MRSKNDNWDVPLTSENLVTCGPAKEETREYDGRKTTWGVFKAYVVFLGY